MNIKSIRKIKNRHVNSTNVFLNWTSLTARRFYISLINCLAERIWRICSEDAEPKIEFSNLSLYVSNIRLRQLIQHLIVFQRKKPIKLMQYQLTPRKNSNVFLNNRTFTRNVKILRRNLRILLTNIINRLCLMSLFKPA